MKQKQKTVTEKRFGEYHEDDKSITLRSRSATCGGFRGTRYLLYQKTIGALCATDYKWVQQEQVMQGKLIVYETDRNNSRPSDSEGNT